MVSGLCLRRMEVLDPILQNLAAYPRWLVAACGVIVALGVLWVLVKVLKWTLYLAAVVVAVVVVGSIVMWWLGR